MEFDRSFKIAAAKSLLSVGWAKELASRYLTILERRKTLRAGVRQARRMAAKHNPLGQIGFTPPLSLAGEPSTLIVRGEGMLLEGIPVALEFDAQGRHRGTSLYEVSEALSIELSKDYGDLEILELYRSLMMAASMKVLADHPIDKYAKIPKFLRRSRKERDELEERLMDFLRAADPRIFSVAVESDDLRDVLCDLPDPCVVLGYAGQGAPFKVQGREVKAVWGSGRGLACVALDDLRGLLRDTGDLVVVDCDREKWEGWADKAVVVVQSLSSAGEPERSRHFKYYEESHD